MKASIFADGESCSAALRARLTKGRFTIVLDGAAEAVRKQRWLPDLLAGDFDTVTPATLRHFQKRGVPLLPTPDQSHTDLEKAIAWCVLRDFRSVWLAQALGGRVDHTFTNLALMRRFHSPERELFLFRDHERVRFARDEKLRLRGRAGRSFAVLPFPSCRALSRGLAYELTGESYAIGVRESTSNRARSSEVRLTIEGEALVVEGF